MRLFIIPMMFLCALTLPTPALADLAERFELVYDHAVVAGSEVASTDDVLSYEVAGGTVATAAGLGGDGLVIDGFHRIDSDSFAFSVNRHVVSDGVVVAPNDIAVNNGGSVSIALDGSSEGIPDAVKIDGVFKDSAGSWVLSVDVHAELGGVVFADGDLIGHDGQDFFMAASETDLGLSTSADVTGIAQGTGGRWLIGLETGGQTLDGLTYFAGDVLYADTQGRLAGIELRSREAPLSVSAGLSAISADPAPDELFSDRFQE